MIVVSDIAKAALWVALQNSSVSPLQGLRVQPSIDGFGLEIDWPADTDRVVYHNSAPVLIIDRSLDEEMNDLLFELGDGPLGMEVIMRPFPGIPNGSCLRFGQDSW